MADGLTLQFDANQQFQLDAVAAAIDLFEGQPDAPEEYVPLRAATSGGLWSSQDLSELGVGNVLRLTDDGAGYLQMSRSGTAYRDQRPSQPTRFRGRSSIRRWIRHAVPLDSVGDGEPRREDLRVPPDDLQALGQFRFQEVHHRVLAASDPPVSSRASRSADHFRALYNEEPRWFINTTQS